MSPTNTLWKRMTVCAKISVVAASVCLSRAPCAAQRKDVFQQKPLSPKAEAQIIYSDAILMLYRDDITDRVADNLRRIIKSFADTSEAEAAQYYLGKYYFRKHFILKDRTGKSDSALLRQAEGAYHDYIKRYGGKPSSEYLADAVFDKFLVFLCSNQWNQAKEQLKFLLKNVAPKPSTNTPDKSKDKQIALDQIIWDAKGKYRVDWRGDAYTLAKSTLDRIEQERNKDALYMIEEIAIWCRNSQKSQSAGEE